MLDREGYRPNVGIILINNRNEVFWGKRVREHSWQFPQGGIKPGESPETAMYRELYEEVGLLPQHVKIIGRTRDWLRYDVPNNWVRREWRGSYRGQKQIWYLLRLTGRDCDVNLRTSKLSAARATGCVMTCRTTGYAANGAALIADRSRFGISCA